MKEDKTEYYYDCRICKKRVYTVSTNQMIGKSAKCPQCKKKPNKLSQEEAEQRALDRNLVLLDIYINAYTKLHFKCYCGKIFLARPHDVWTNRTTSCGCYNIKCGKERALSQEEAEKKSLELGVKLIGKYTNVDTETDFECPKCGKIWHAKPHHVWWNNVSSCGCYKFPSYQLLTQEEAEEKSLKYGVKLVGKYITALIKIEFECPICKKIFKCRPNAIWTKNTKSCGNCKVKRKGVQTSYKALKLHKMVGKGVHNYKSKCKKCIDIALVINNRKIAIEYDEWVWHGHRQEEDRKRLLKLKYNGWRILCIKAHNNLPTQKQLDEALYELAYTNRKKYTIKLNGWGIGKTRFEK